KDVGLDGQSGSVGEYGWAGAGGTYFWIDPKEELIAILMTQAPGPSRTYYRQLFKELVQQALWPKRAPRVPPGRSQREGGMEGPRLGPPCGHIGRSNVRTMNTAICPRVTPVPGQ